MSTGWTIIAFIVMIAITVGVFALIFGLKIWKTKFKARLIKNA